MTKRLPMAPFILLPALQAPAAMPSAVRKQIESSRLVADTITVDESGQVADCTLDGATDLGTELVDYSFDPDAGKGHESRWEACIPGPRQLPPRRNWDASEAIAPDSLVAGSVTPIGERVGRLRLRTPLDAS